MTCINAIAHGACALDPERPPNTPLPIIPDDPAARYTPTKEFVEKMVEFFKEGGKLPKRVVWEVVLGVKALLDQEPSLVEATVPEGVTCDIVGDSECRKTNIANNSPWRKQGSSRLLTAAILRPCQPLEHYQASIRNSHDCLQRRLCRPRFLVCRSRAHIIRVQVAVPRPRLPEPWQPRDQWCVHLRVLLTPDMNKVYGFEGECKAKHGEMTYKLFADVFTARESRPTT